MIRSDGTDEVRYDPEWYDYKGDIENWMLKYGSRVYKPGADIPQVPEWMKNNDELEV